MTPPLTLPAKPEPTNACLRCGRPIPIEDSLCELCNPLGLRQPAATQVHAIAVGGILLFVVILAVLGKVALSGVGPFSGAAGSVVAATSGLAMTISVTNQGTKDAATTCRVTVAGGMVGGPSQVIQTPVVPAGQTITFSAILGVFGDVPRAMAVECASP